VDVMRQLPGSDVWSLMAQVLTARSALAVAETLREVREQMKLLSAQVWALTNKFPAL